MAALRRPKLRCREQRLTYRSAEHVDTEIWLPLPDDPHLRVRDFADAAALATTFLDAPIEHEALVLLDTTRSITAIVFDPPVAIGLFPVLTDPPGLEVPYCSTLSIVVAPSGVSGPSVDDARGYFALRRYHALQGLWLLDVMLVNTERVTSVAVHCDPDCVWFDDPDLALTA